MVGNATTCTDVVFITPLTNQLLNLKSTRDYVVKGPGVFRAELRKKRRSVGKKMGFVWECFDQPSCECGMGTAGPSTTAKAVALGCASNASKRAKSKCHTHSEILCKKQGEYGVTDINKTVKHHPKMILSVT